ncbi:MAG: hypothetical protein US52_C0056G0007, partial [candidate division WS6 bacterium GW2011_GWA2_37_6]
GICGETKMKGKLITAPKKLNQKEYAHESFWPFSICLSITLVTVKHEPAIIVKKNHILKQ